MYSQLMQIVYHVKTYIPLIPASTRGHLCYLQMSAVTNVAAVNMPPKVCPRHMIKVAFLCPRKTHFQTCGFCQFVPQKHANIQSHQPLRKTTPHNPQQGCL